jgi:hypothetical protein
MKQLLMITAAALLTLGGGSTARAEQPDPAQAIANWFQHFLGHPVDPGSLYAWQSVLTSQGPLATVAGLLSSEDYWLRNGSTPQGVVLGMHRDVLGQPPWQVPPQNVDYWVNKLAQYGSRQAMAQEFLSAARVDLYALGAGEAAPPLQAYTPPAYAPPTYVPPAYTPTPTYSVPYWATYSYRPRPPVSGWWRHLWHERREHWR